MEQNLFFNQNETIEKLGEKFGYFFAYFTSTTILYLFLKIFEKIPIFWSYIHIILATLIITIFGIIIKRFLE